MHFPRLSIWTQVLVCVGLLVYLPLWIATISISSRQLEDVQDTYYILPLAGSDSQEYKELAHSILKTHSFQLAQAIEPETFRTPGYPAFIALVLFVFKTFFAITFIQCVLTVATAVVFYKLLTKYSTERVARISSIVYLVGVGVITHALILMSDTLFVFLFILTIYILFGNEKITYKKVVYAGITLACATLVRPIAMFLPLVLGVFVAAKHYRLLPKKQIAEYLGVFVVTFALILAPWIMRNHAVAGRFSLSSLSVYNLFHYNIPEYIATKQGISAEEARAAFEVHVSSEAQQHPRSLRYAGELSRVSIDYIKQHFVSYTIFHGVKTVPFFLTSSLKTGLDIYNNLYAHDINFNIDRGNLSSQLLKADVRGLMTSLRQNGLIALEQVWWLLILTLALYAVCRRWRDQFVLGAFILILYFAFLTGPVSYARYRLPAEPFLVSLAVIATMQVLTDIRRIWPNRA